ncbi:hypothetical protein C2845_PM08G16140 [Panicum miliaceum]|uniref:Uncharacterized protein n=1 Tax=Panicum miliaceum TaxID=4540 RepID=A0A3L6R4F2_PANMI|nr:hypothetical protein C2845_PM08G16140 [Panicum miliaceum]
MPPSMTPPPPLQHCYLPLRHTHYHCTTRSDEDTHADGARRPPPAQWRRTAARSAARQHTESGAERAPAPEAGAGAGASAAEAAVASAATATKAAITAAETRAIAAAGGVEDRPDDEMAAPALGFGGLGRRGGGEE